LRSEVRGISRANLIAARSSRTDLGAAQETVMEHMGKAGGEEGKDRKSETCLE
jgi:hypothetical protein